MKTILKKYLFLVLTLYCLTQLFSSFDIKGGWQSFLYASFVLYLLQNIFKPLISFLFLPVNILTLNLSVWILNILIFYLWILVVKEVSISAWWFGGMNFGPLSVTAFYLQKWQSIVILSILVTLISRFFNWLVR